MAGLSGCGSDPEPADRYTPAATTPAPEPGIWATGLTPDLYNKLGEVAVAANFALMGEVGAKPVLLEGVAYQVIDNCANVAQGIESWDELIAGDQQIEALNDGGVVSFYHFVRDQICPNVDPSKLE